MIKAVDEKGKSALKTALECAYELLLQKIISNPNDMMGILLFGTVAHLATVVDYARNKQKLKATMNIFIL